MLPVIGWVLIGVLGVAVVAFWDDLREWASTTLADAVGRLLGHEAREVLLDLLTAADRVIAGVRRVARAVIRELRQALLQAVIAIERKTNNQYVRQLTGFVRKVVEGQQKVYRVVVEEEIPFDDLPDSVRAGFIRGQQRQVAELDLEPQLLS